ncbi:MAG: DUF4126 domain-containing protein [Vicinamibacteria bacterium]
MDALLLIGRTLGFSLAAGVNLYATVAVLGLAARFEWVALPEQFAVFDSNWVIGIALALYAVEFVADKVPWLDTAWDAVHTFIRPLGGALIAITTLGEASPLLQALVGLAGGAVAAGSHLSKAGTRAAVNTSPEPVSNWTLSLLEDGFVIGLGLVALKYPLLALAVVALAVLAMALAARWLWRRLRSRPGTA